MQTYKCALFDMDGTILNSIMDLKNAVNYVMNKYGYSTFDKKEIEAMLGNGNKYLMEQALPDGKNDKDFDKKYQMFLDYYFSHCKEESEPYDGIIDLLRFLKEKNIKTAVVSNKYDKAVQELVNFYFKDLFDISLGIKENTKVKPNPEIVNNALDILGVDKKDAIYIGDSEVDAKTAENSMLKYLLVSWGFRKRDDLLKLNPIEIIDNAYDIKKYF